MPKQKCVQNTLNCTYMYMNQAVRPFLPILEVLRPKMTLIKFQQQKEATLFQDGLFR
jgi:hypothetical protein